MKLLSLITIQLEKKKKKTYVQAVTENVETTTDQNVSCLKIEQKKR